MIQNETKHETEAPNAPALASAMRGLTEALARPSVLAGLGAGREVTFRIRVGSGPAGTRASSVMCEVEEPAGSEVDLRRSAELLSRLGARFTQAAMKARRDAAVGPGNGDLTDALSLENAGVALLEAALRVECAIDLRRPTAGDDLGERVAKLEQTIAAMGSIAKIGVGS